MNTIYITGVIGNDVTLKSVISQYNSLSNPQEVEVVIDSPGGGVDEGRAIYSYLKNLPVPVTTVAKMAFSIASIIFMAGSKRVVLSGNDRVMIHMPWVRNATGGRLQLEKLTTELQILEDEFVELYGSIIKADESSIRTLLTNETYISSDDAISLGFATEIREPLRAVAFLSDAEEKPKSKLNIMKNANILVQALKAFINQSTVALVLQDANGVEITFPEVEEGEPAIGDSATVDGLPANGEYISPTGETWVFVDGSLTEVKSVEQEDEIDDIDDIESTDTEMQDLLEKLFSAAKLETTKEVEVLIESLKNDNQILKDELVAVKKLIGSDDFKVDVDESQPIAKTKGERAVQILNSRRTK